MTVQSYDRTTVRPYNHTTVRLYDRMTIQGATFSTCSQLYHWHYLIISPLHGHGEVANENPLILPHTLSIRRDVQEKKMQALLLGLPKSIYYAHVNVRYK